MLTFDQIITLTDKGFSPDQIVKLTGEELPTDPPADPSSPPSAVQELFKNFTAEVAEMRKALQASNIRTVIRDDIPPEKSADDILAEIIHPTISKEVSNK